MKWNALQWNDGRSIQSPDDESFVYSHDIHGRTMAQSAVLTRDVDEQVSGSNDDSMKQLRAYEKFPRIYTLTKRYCLCILSSLLPLMAIFAEVTENERIIDRHLRGTHPLLDYDASESQSMISI